MRECFFGQYSASGITIEHNSGGVSDGRIRLYYNLGSAVSQEYADITVVAGEWASIAATSEPGAQTVWKNGAASQSMSNPLNGTLVADCNSVIGCDLSRTAMSFRGTYNVFRLYDRVLTEDEIRLNAAVDAHAAMTGDSALPPETTLEMFVLRTIGALKVAGGGGGRG